MLLVLVFQLLLLANGAGGDKSTTSKIVSPDGELFVLATDRANYKALYLLKAGKDPSNFSSTRLDVPDGLDPMTVNGFAVLPSGETLLHAYSGEEAPKADRGRSYFLELDASGKLRKSSGEVSDSAAKDIDKGIVPMPIAPAIAGDGLIYVLGPNKMVGLYPSGEVARTILLSPPKDGYDAPFDLRAAGSRFLLTWRKGGERRLETEYELLDESTGEVLRLYRPTDSKDILVCFTGHSLIFDGGKDKAGNVRLVTAPLN